MLRSRERTTQGHADGHRSAAQGDGGGSEFESEQSSMDGARAAMVDPITDYPVPTVNPTVSVPTFPFQSVDVNVAVCAPFAVGQL